MAAPISLSSNEFLRVLPEEVARRLEAQCVRKGLPDGQRLFGRGDAADGLYRVLRGQVKVVGRGADGREFVLTYLGPGQWFGEISLFDGLPRTHDAYAKGDTELLLLPRREFRAIVDERPELYRSFLELMCSRLRMTFAMIEDAAFLPLPARLARRLLGLVQQAGRPVADGVRIDLHLPQEELGQLLGVSREAVGRHLKSWERSGWIALEYGRIVVREPAALQALVQAPPPHGL